MDKEKQQKLTELLSSSRKKYGDVVVDKDNIKKCDVISTGSLSVDIATGIGGIPRGRVTEVSGEESSGKTTLILQTIAEAQKAGGAAAFIDAENALDGTYAQNLGVNMDELVISQPDTAEQTISIILDWSQSGLFDLLVIDSVAAMIPRAVLEGEVEDKHMALLARMLSENLPKVTKAAARSNSSIVLINQLRSNMGSSGPYGPTTTTTGGKAIKFFCSMRIQTARTGSTKDGDLVTGNKTKVKIIKNKLAPPFREAETNIVFGEGYDLNGEIIDLGTKLHLIEKSGTWYSYKGERMGQGKENSKAFLIENPDIRQILYNQIREMHSL